MLSGLFIHRLAKARFVLSKQARVDGLNPS